MSDPDLDTRPVGEVLNGLAIPPLLDGHTPLDAVVLVKTLDLDGRETWHQRTTDRISDVECLGALLATAATVEDDVVQVHRGEQ